MTKAELAQKLATSFDLSSKSEGEKIISFIFDEIASSLVNREEIAIAGFGKFLTADRAAREGVNPSTGEKIKIAATTVTKFKAAKQLKDAVAK
ncbi:HU family DNA-binding protein [Spiroplasma endosymbiont of Aspidapion aeneum]|uniref:HU family DNA-binding protein n=1 Tax=Spiroplasma endosymbiont of Aspidapion aeneum TaxID=3066276 RepID=UPI00313BDE72